MIIWRNLIAQSSTSNSIFREPEKELAEPMGSIEPVLKNNELDNTLESLRLYVLMSNRYLSSKLGKETRNSIL